MSGQTYHGHVTISPNATMVDYFNFLEDIEPTQLPVFINETYIKTMRRMSLIRSLYSIEREFEKGYSRLKKKLIGK